MTGEKPAFFPQIGDIVRLSAECHVAYAGKVAVIIFTGPYNSTIRLFDPVTDQQDFIIHPDYLEFISHGN